MARQLLVGSKVTDLHGATVLPGLIDTHPHVLHFGARQRAVLDIGDCRNHREIVERIRAKAAVTPAGNTSTRPGSTARSNGSSNGGRPGPTRASPASPW